MLATSALATVMLPSQGHREQENLSFVDEGLKEDNIPTVTPIDKIPDEGNWGRLPDFGVSYGVTICRPRACHESQAPVTSDPSCSARRCGSGPVEVDFPLGPACSQEGPAE